MPASRRRDNVLPRCRATAPGVGSGPVVCESRSCRWVPAVLRTALAVVALLCGTLVAPLPAAAQGDDPFSQLSDDDLQAAFRLLDEADEAEADGRWDDAVEALEQLMELAPAPVVELQLARALANAGRLDDAERAYLHVIEAGDPESATMARQRLADLREQRAAAAPAEPDASAPGPSEPEPSEPEPPSGPEPSSVTRDEAPGTEPTDAAVAAAEPAVDGEPAQETGAHDPFTDEGFDDGGSNTWFIGPAVVTVVAVSAIAASGLAYANAQRLVDEANRSKPTLEELVSVRNDAENARTLFYVSAGFAGAFTAAAIVTWVVKAGRNDSSDAGAQIGFAPTRGGGAATLGWRW